MPSVIDEYRRLVTAAESGDALDDAIALVLRIAGGENGGPPKSRRWGGLPSVEADLAAFIDHHAGPKARGLPGPRAAQRLWRAAWLLENIPPRVERAGSAVPEAVDSLLADALLVLFHQAYFALPPAAGEGRRRERAALLASFRRFAEHLPRDADRYEVLGLIFDAEGSKTKARDCYRTALSATRADEHDFITRVQMLWTHHTETGDLAGAGRLLLDVYPRVSRRDLDEVSEMLWDTMRAFEDRVTTRRAAHA